MDLFSTGCCSVTMGEIGLKTNKLSSGVSDGQNRNTTISKHLNDDLKSFGFPGLVNVMPYNVRGVYNDFKHGLSKYGQLAEKLATDLYYWFKAHPAHKKGCFKIQTSLGFD